MSRTSGATTAFMLVDVPPELDAAVRELGFGSREGRVERRFPTDSLHIDQAFSNLERFAEEMVLQIARQRPVPWERALETLIDVADPSSASWWLTGSIAIAVRGVDVEPRDIDLVVDRAGALELGSILKDHLVEPVTRVTDWISGWWGRAFLGARVEWIGDVVRSVDRPYPTDFGPAAATRLETVEWHGHQLRVPPIDLQIAVSERRGLLARAERLRELIG